MSLTAPIRLRVLPRLKPINGVDGRVLNIVGGTNVEIDETDPSNPIVSVPDAIVAGDGRLLPAGGATGRILAKSSDSDFDAEWVASLPGGGDMIASAYDPQGKGTELLFKADAGVSGLAILAGSTEDVIRNYLDIFPAKRPEAFGYSSGGSASAKNTAMLAWAADTWPHKSLGNGTYEFTSDLVIASACTVSGFGIGKSILQRSTAGTNTSALKVTSGGVTFKNFSLVGPTSAAYILEESGIRFQGTSQASRIIGGGVSGVEISNFGAYGIRHQYHDRYKDELNYIHDVGYGGIFNLSCAHWSTVRNYIDTVGPGTSANAYGIAATCVVGEAVCDDFHIDFNTAMNIPIWEGFDTHGGTNGTFIGNYTLNIPFGISVAPNGTSSTQVPSNIVVANNFLVNGTTSIGGRGIGLTGSLTTQAANLVCVGNTLIGFGEDVTGLDGALLVQATDNAVVTGNSVKDSIGAGVCLKLTNNNISVAGNNVNGVTGTFGNLAAIRVPVGTHTGLVQGNTFNGGAKAATVVNVTTASGLLFGVNNYVTSGGTLHTLPQNVAFLSPPAGIAVNSANANFTLVSGVAKAHQIITATATAQRTITLTAPVVNLNTCRYHIVHVGSGNFSWIIGATGEFLAPGEWVTVDYNPTAAAFFVAARGRISRPEIALTDAATIAWDMSLGDDFTVTLAGNRTLGNPTNTVVGKRGRIRVVQDGTGSRTLTKSSNHKTAGGAAITLSSAAAAVDYIEYDCRSATEILLKPATLAWS